MGRIVGIDLGTTNSLVAVWENGTSTLIPKQSGGYLTPSIVSIDEDGTFYVGDIAKERQVTHPKNTVAIFKRFMGTSKTYCLAGKEYKPEELSALVLRKLKEDAENYLQEEIEEAIISVPAYFNDLARNATKNAGKLAGLKVKRIINEPSAAALAYQHLHLKEEATILVFDFGGGTLDVSLVDCFENIVEILAVSGDNHLGGSDFDQIIAEKFIQKNQLGYIKITSEQRAIILEKATAAKRELTKQDQTIMQVSLDGNGYTMPISRLNLIEWSSTLFERMTVPVRKVLSDARTDCSSVTAVVLVGGSCKMPVVQKYIEHILGRKDISVLNPDYMVAVGTGVYAGIKERNADIKDMLLTDVCPFSLGTGVHNEVENGRDVMEVLIERNTALPASREINLCTIKDNQKSINVTIHQGEEYFASDNLWLGSINVPVPIASKGKETITLRYTYDINGILIVDVKVDSTGLTKQLIIKNEDIRLTEEEMNEKLVELNKLKIHPREKEENQILLERAHRLYAESIGGLRNDIERRAQYFEYLLSTQDEFRICRAVKQFDVFLNYIEGYMMEIEQPTNTVDSFKAWYMEGCKSEEEKDEWEEDEYLFENWKRDGYLTS